MKPCVTCKGQKMIQSPGGILQRCPECDGTGVDPGIESFFEYTTSITLTAGLRLTGQQQQMQGDFPFRLKLLAATSTGSFSIQLYDGNYRALCNDYTPNVNLFGSGAFPFVVAPHPEYPKTGTIQYDILDTSGAGNTVVLTFHGAKVAPTPGA